METLSTVNQEDSSGANPSSIKSDDSTPPHDSGRGSPPPNCAICLGTCKNKSFTDSCLHQFCFTCLLTWSKVKAECPLCKQNFKSIIHNVRSNHQYEEYLVEQQQSEDNVERLDIDSLTAAAAPRFRYRTTLTLPRRESMTIQQLLLHHYPMIYPPPAPRVPPARRRPSPSSFRRTVYRHNLWARPLPDFTGRFRDCSPEFYRYNPAQTYRLVPWLNRELNYLLNENEGHILYLKTKILELLPQCHINSAEFRNALQRSLGERTEHFLHELYCFASTPYDLTGYDRNVQYTTDSRISTMVDAVISSSESDVSVDSDIVMVSSSQPAEPPPGPSALPPPGPSRIPPPAYPQNYISQPATNVIPIETISHSDTDDDDSEVMVVGYIKPPQNRTPEIVDLLGSDSDVVVQDAPLELTRNTPTSEPQETRPGVPLVKLSLKRHSAPTSNNSDSEDSTYRPSPVSRLRKRPRRSNDTATTTSDRWRSTPSPSPSPSPAAPATAPLSALTALTPLAALTPLSPLSPPSPPSPASPIEPRSVNSYTSYTTPSSSSELTTDEFSGTTYDSSSSADRRKRTPKKKSRRKIYTKTRKDKESEKNKKKNKKRSRSHHRDKKNSLKTLTETDKRSKSKSLSGKGVKSSNRNIEEISIPLEQSEPAENQPSTSGVSRRLRSNSSRDEKRRSSRESRRLKSVVNVMSSQRNSNNLISNGNSNLLNILSSAILNPNSNVLAYNSDSGSIPGDDRTRKGNVPAELLEKADSCFNVQLPTTGRTAPAFDSEDDLPLNLSVKKTPPLSQ